MAVARRLVRRERRLTRRLSALSLYFVALVGVALLVFGATRRSNTIPQLTLLSVGASLLASAGFVYITSSRERIEQEFLDLGVQWAFLDRAQAFTNEDWADLVRSARHRYRVLGVANHGYSRAENAVESEEALKTAIGRRVNVEILFLNPDTQMAGERQKEEVVRSTLEDTINAIEWFWRVKQSLPDDEQRDRLSLKLYESLPTCGITWVDDYLIISHYLAGEANRFAPGFVLTDESGVLRALLTMRLPRTGRQLAHKYKAHFLKIAGSDTTRELDQAAINDLTAQKDALPKDKVSEEKLHE